MSVCCFLCVYVVMCYITFGNNNVSTKTKYLNNMERRKLPRSSIQNN